MIPTLGGIPKRGCPAPPGFITVTVRSTSSSSGLCVCPYTMISALGKASEHRGRRPLELIPVGHHDGESVELELRHLRQPRPKLGAVRVTVHGRYWCQRPQLNQDFGPANVARVQDMVDLLECVEHFGPQQTVRIGDNP